MKRIITAFFLVIAGAFLFAQSDEMAMYNDLYNACTTIAEQVYVVEQVLDANPQGATEFFASALHNLVVIYPRQTDKNEINAADRKAVLLSRALGDAQYTDAGPDLWFIYQEFKGGQDTPLAKATALEALGKVKAAAYFPQLVQVLKDLNANPPADRDTQIQNERIAYGAILGLENYKEAAGYDPVFFASLGWYSLRIKRQAVDSLPKITDDPTDFLVSVVNAPSYTGLNVTINPVEVKYEALRTSDSSASPDNRKALVAQAALYQGHNIKLSDIHQREVLASMRKLALNMIRRYGSEDEAVYPLVDRSYNDGINDEKLAALYVLRDLSGENSARLLSAYLRELHSRRAVGAGTQRQKQEEDSYMRVIIPALGQIGPAARAYAPPILRMVQNTNVWTGYVQGLAREALQKIGN